MVILEHFVLAFTFFLVSFISFSTQGYVPGPCCTIDAEQVQDTDRAEWCADHVSRCNVICGGPDLVVIGGSRCNNVFFTSLFLA